ncbi:MAG: phosphoribosylaminoimidazole-succinocarboxamide synthase [Candidatus Eremiobacteraeota bacterium]|jgi:phosphoribosylaminoimidazole-succinocarboxamide synthase|nr:phosphoribosylaminoimidazole-succinocarboxamide synthase [Candidatus Eremiobacteraeota bacterium]
MRKGHEIARGKTKVLYELDGQPDVLVVQQQDGITARDGERRDVIEGKGRIAAQTTARVFRLLNLCGLPTHYLNGGEDDDDNEMLVRRAHMIPLEVVVRGVAAGSLVKRRPAIQRGALLVPRLLEFFIKDDANHDPQIEPDAIVAQGIATPQEIAAMQELARITFEILAHAWRRHNALLVDLKIEFGRIASGEGKGQLIIADVVDNDSWRVWPQGREELMLDKQLYRNLEVVTQADLDQVRANYEQVADIVGTFPQMRPGMVAMLADGPEHGKAIEELARALGAYGLPSVRHVVSVARTPGYVLQLLAQLEATFARMVLVAIGADTSALPDVLDNATASPVLFADSVYPRADEIALRCAKAFALEDTVVFGRILLLQANARSMVLAADAELNAPPPPQAPGVARA